MIYSANYLLVVPLALTLTLSLTCTNTLEAYQSGSRGGGGGGGSSAPSQSAPSLSFNAPSPTFDQPSSFGQPSFNQSVPAQQSFGQPANMGFNQSGPSQNPAASSMTNPNSSGQSNSSGSSSSSLGVPDSQLVDPIFEINNPYSSHVVDHSTWNNFLAQYLTTGRRGVNRIHYRSVSSCDREQLKGYLNYLQSLDIRTLNRQEQLAYWFNLYNAKTADVVLQNYPLRSIRQVKQKLTDFVGPFDDEGAVTVLGKSLSLNDIESGIIRPVWNDPRIHYALNCASYSCPNLSPTAWTASNLDARLNGAAYDYVNSGRAVKPGLFGNRVSKIYKWYEDDFGGSKQGVIQHIQQYANPNISNRLGRRRISGYFYDWSLNDARIRRRRLFEPLIR